MTSIARARAAALLAVLMLPLSLVGCIQGSGPIVTETRDVRPFSGLDVGSGIHVLLKLGAAGPLQVSAQQNVLPAIATEVSGSTLKVGANDDFLTSTPVVVTVTTPTLASVSTSGGAEVSVEALEADVLELGSGVGRGSQISGSANTVSLVADGGSIVDLDDLVAEAIDVRVAGAATGFGPRDRPCLGVGVGGCPPGGCR